MTQRAMAIVGAGHVGGRAAQALREAGWQGRIVLVGAEPHWPYERPPLSKGLLTGERAAQQCALRAPQAWRDDHIERLHARVLALDPARRTLTLDTGGMLAHVAHLDYEALLLATGGHVRRLAVPVSAAASARVLYLRTLDDAAAIAPRLAPGARLAVVGGGFIGLEVAASARSRGCEVTVIEGGPRLLGRAVPEALAAQVHALHARNGVRIVLGAAVQAIEAHANGALAVLHGSGESADSVEADTVVVGIGIEPADEIARAAGLAVERGILVDETLQTSAPGIYAAGDVAVFPSRFGAHRLRQETWHNAETQARVAAHNLLGAREVYRELPWFWSDQYDHQLQVAGEPALARQTVVRALDGNTQIRFDFADERRAGHDGHVPRLVAASGFGPANALAKEMRVARMLVEREVTAAPAVLADAAVKLKSLLA
ncbi:FAD-dependent oxidoreductase [Paraburkholderia acidisoli]|uniref:Pyridine nucleotide-disulfide oxidoreductase n=1 Tax=Paraburkholderia acidisoli TaxID=2571748 RepID=A0A7Z2GNB5_9BURK|nr:FAD-dependent oxidoreductase [Paraburkholderia acidisoli]QGZ64873.1 pyridine nucleotide-disulfide oxidoreductase [Paraburkholderia acidisoli]